MDNSILTSKEICEILQIPTRFLYSEGWRKFNGIPVFFKGRFIYAYYGRLCDWIRAKKG